ncbi:MAG: hypothetical protein GW906_10345 [Epsilonproteobacteria bacterium]|nr:hypothetical protein [Campylobacterota bacterium]OIO15696.1 MAG: hypothetical protein AUJ81_06510 [Helicobacteraceae bacterium CG1_02_36_14]PIP10394.1 MAG: hypothetical protein COX50_06050 [Sulfurimonas sp. CG23_combo_of_CG06-09_8_20_14_all_36_33]PIS24967.1 MAG: hypothetical protein COT46_07695 [Sulfurimonas sp. CG08_land_8_20_14_0_20_36_33]PIU34136.1 MAG: hypothetical protein COT05_08960 [Sulfurimonas sp. CG07_land_8_20_14_0_80_36_56]PIV04970.1 MAG: hypothetical protein COS56_03160 [Sulfur
MNEHRLFKVGQNLVKFAWTVEIIAVLIGFLISIIVSYSVFIEMNKLDRALTFGDYSSVIVSGLPFLLVAIVEATKIPLATAMMYAKHTSWRILFLIGIVMLVLITFETMINGFERNFANLTFAIEKRKNDAMLLQHSIDNIEEEKRKIDIINIENVENAYLKKITMANQSFNQQVQHQSDYINEQLNSMDDSFKTKTDAELNDLYNKETKIYEAWDKERESTQQRLRSLLNQNIKGANTDKDKLEQEVQELKNEMKQKMAEANFLTRQGVEKEYRELIAKKEKRLYAVSDYSTGTKALDQQTDTEKQLQEQLKAVGNGYQKRIDSIRSRINYLNKQLKEHQNSNEFLQAKYRKDLEIFTNNAHKNKSNLIKRAGDEKQVLYGTYEEIQAQVKIYDAEIYALKIEQKDINYDMNRLVNQNQVYRVASYVSGKDNGLDVPKGTVGLVALLWFASLAFITSITGVFLAIAGLYVQKCYAPEETKI